MFDTWFDFIQGEISTFIIQIFEESQKSNESLNKHSEHLEK